VGDLLLVGDEHQYREGDSASAWRAPLESACTLFARQDHLGVLYDLFSDNRRLVMTSWTADALTEDDALARSHVCHGPAVGLS
jgi:hypothetical protein